MTKWTSNCEIARYFLFELTRTPSFLFFFFLMIRPPPRSTPFPYTTLSRSRLDLAAHDPHPMPMPAHGSFEPRARHLEHVAASQRTVRVEPILERPARRGTIVHRYTSRRLAGRPFDAHLNERPVLRAADAEVGRFEAQPVQAGPKRLDEAVGEHKKKRGPNFARFTGRNLPARRRLSSDPKGLPALALGARFGRRQPGVGDHAPVAPTRSAVRGASVAVVRSAPGADGDPLQRDC